MAKFCTSCGAPLEDAVKFCTNCGAQNAAPQPPPPQPPAQAWQQPYQPQGQYQYPQPWGQPPQPSPYYAYPQYYQPAPPSPPPKKKKHRLRKFVCWTAAVLLVLVVAGKLLGDSGVFRSGNEDLMGELFPAGETWALYWYLCGTDLETRGGFASKDLAELCKVTLPAGVQVVVETGGAKTWTDKRVDAGSLCRFLYSGSQLTLLEKQPAASMGEGGTLADFLSFCRENYPADHEAVILWDHGGGSLGGIICDERYNMDCLDLPDLRAAFERVYPPSEKKPPLELIGFDACLMATIETAHTFQGIAKYMVASEETVPGCGWEYSGLLRALAEEPRLNGAMLGKAICETYASGCEAADAADKITLSCVDLTRIEPLLAAWHNVGVEALAAACNNPNFFSTYGRSAAAAEKYGPNERSFGFTGMVDMGDMARGAASALPQTAGAIEAALLECIVYRVNGPYRMQNTGLSFYYPLEMSQDKLLRYAEISTSQAHNFLYEFLVCGQLSWEGAQYAGSMEYLKVPSLPKPKAPEVAEFSRTALPQAPSVQELHLAGHPVTLDEDYNATLVLGKEIADQLAGVYFRLAYIDKEEDTVYVLGRDNDLWADWENGVFTDNFRGAWGAIDGHFVYMELTSECEDYDLYFVPILLNGEERSLQVSYVYETGGYEILGATRGLDENGTADKELLPLQPGDEIATLHYAASLSGEDDEVYYAKTNIFTVTEDTAFTEEMLNDGLYGYMFQMVDARGTSVLSESIIFSVEDGEIYVETD